MFKSNMGFSTFFSRSAATNFIRDNKLLILGVSLLAMTGTVYAAATKELSDGEICAELLSYRLFCENTLSFDFGPVTGIRDHLGNFLGNVDSSASEVSCQLYNMMKNILSKEFVEQCEDKFMQLSTMRS